MPPVVVSLRAIAKWTVPVTSAWHNRSVTVAAQLRRYGVIACTEASGFRNVNEFTGIVR